MLRNKDLLENLGSPCTRTALIDSVKSLKIIALCIQPCCQASQNIVKEGLTRKVFRNKELAGKTPRLWIPANPFCSDRLRCECAQCHCGFLVARVKVGCHNESNFRCGKCDFAFGRTWIDENGNDSSDLFSVPLCLSGENLRISRST